MKKIVSVFCCLLLLLGLILPLMPTAQAVLAIKFVGTVKAYVGDTLSWTVTEVLGGGPYDYQFDLYRNDQLVGSSGSIPYNNRQFKADAIGEYKCVITVYDRRFGDTRVFADIPLAYVTAMPAARIQKVEAISASALKVSWAAVPLATRYELYSATAKNGPYKLVRATTATSLSVGSLKAGTQYFFKLRYLTEGGTLSPMGPLVTGVPIGRAAITGISSPAKGQIKLVWAKTAGATGYQVLTSAKSTGPFKVVRTLPGTQTSFTGIKSASRLFFQVRPYKKIYATVHYGLTSATKSVLVK